MARKARLFLEWNWAMFFPPDIAHLSYARTRRVPRGGERGSAAAGAPPDREAA